MGSTRHAKGSRKARRRTDGRTRRDDTLSMQALGGVMDPRLAERILAAARDVDLDAHWAALAPRILPVLKRRRHPYPPEAAPFHLSVPPGIPTGFGIDFGPAFSHVTTAMLERWAIDRATILGTALENLRRLIVTEPPQVQAFTLAGTEIVGIQGQGWGSSLVLLPEALRPILGATPRVLLAPVRNTLLALPQDVDIELAAMAWEALADGAHDELDVEPMRWTGTSVVAIGDPSEGRPN